MFWQKRRYIIVLLAFLGYISNYSLRVNLSVAIVKMTEIREIVHENGTIGYVLHMQNSVLTESFTLFKTFLGARLQLELTRERTDTQFFLLGLYIYTIRRWCFCETIRRKSGLLSMLLGNSFLISNRLRSNV